MPCRVDDEEVRLIEKSDNHRKYGIATTDADIAVTVACQAMQFIEAHYEGKLKPTKLCRVWYEEHKRKDEERKRDEDAAKKQQEADEQATLRRLLRKYPNTKP